MIFPITEHVAKRNGHTSFYLACGAADAPLIIFVHGWPELSISWRNQLPVFAALGFKHLMASSTLPEVYTYEEIQGRKFWDGGLLSNTPVRELLEAHKKF